jgi:P27 family predicted phage terminase small subunit
MTIKKPPELRVVEGNAGKRPILRPPQPTPGAPSCPAHLRGVARRCWTATVRELERMGLATEADRIVLESLCMSYSLWRSAMDELANGITVQDRAVRRKHPAWQIAREAQAAMLSAAKELGLTPRARVALARPEPTLPDDVARILD